MLPKRFFKTIFQSNLRHLNVHIRPRSANPVENYCSYSRSKLLRITFSPVLSCRNYSDSQKFVQLPCLTDDPRIVWPSFFKTISNFIQCNLVIRPYMDKDFDITEFIDGSKHALSVVSNALANEDYESIENLVHKDTIQSTRNKISTLSLEQKQLIAINKEDIYLTYPYQVGIMFDNNKAQQRFVEITVVYHTLRGLAKMRAENKEPPINLGLLPEFQKLIFICNYRFVREFTKDVESSWTINMINHFMPASIN